jgi:hypothetical protein
MKSFIWIQMLDFDGEARNGILNMPLIGAVAFVV